MKKFTRYYLTFEVLLRGTTSIIHMYSGIVRTPQKLLTWESIVFAAEGAWGKPIDREKLHLKIILLEEC